MIIEDAPVDPKVAAYCKRRRAQGDAGLDVFTLGSADEWLLKALQYVQAAGSMGRHKGVDQSEWERKAIQVLADDLEALHQRLHGLQRRMSARRRAAKEAAR